MAREADFVWEAKAVENYRHLIGILAREEQRVEPRQRRAAPGVGVHVERQPGPAPVQLGAGVWAGAGARVGAPVQHRAGRGVGAALPSRPVRLARGAPRPQGLQHHARRRLHRAPRRLRPGPRHRDGQDLLHGGGRRRRARLHGTVGYIAPECFHTEKATRESDVYAFDAVILEVVCGRRPRCDIDDFHFLVDWVWRLHRDGRALEAVDPGLDGAFDEDDAERLLMLGLACSHPTPAKRPKAHAISQILPRSMPTPAVPPFKPSFVWPATDGGFGTMSTTAGSTSSRVVTSTSHVGATRGQPEPAPGRAGRDRVNYTCVGKRKEIWRDVFV
ncbi:hypothetical protein ZWY2020_010540 [Hordeum vulgare]|nr:hypothetical protein ZWY2020_010540 [Hordeum vulgare]